MIKNQIILEINKDQRIYQFHLSPESPLGEVFDVLNQMRAEILERINSSVQEQNKKSSDPENS
jgi:hypothetical protein